MYFIIDIIAISGLHISLIGMCVFQLLKRIKLPITVATMVSIFIIYSYGVLTNFSVSTNRAVVMMVVMLLSSLFGKTYDILSSLALSAFLILLQNPLQIFSTGFLLSFGAVLGIAVLYPSLQKIWKVKKRNMHDESTGFTEKNVDEKNENTEIEIRDKESQGEKIRGNEVLGKEVRGEEVQSKEIQSKEIQGEETVIEKAATDTKNGMQLVVNKIMDSILLSFSAQIATTPFLLLFFFQLPTYSIITNLLILPFVSVLTITSILAGIAGIIYMPLGIFLIGGSNYILKLYEWICRAGSSLPGHMITIGKPDRIRILIYFFLVFLFVWLTTKYEKRKTLWIIVVAYVMLLFPDGNNGLEITILDVGQGDSIFISSENGNTYLVDSGSSDIKQLGSYRIQPFLHSKGIDRLTYIIITHSDYDHTSGVTELITEDLIKVETLVLPKLTSKDDAYLELELLAKERGIELRYISTGDLIRDGALTMLCLHPSQNYAASSPNSYSTVLSVNYGDFDMLLTGDLEKDGEALLSKLLKKPGIWDGYEIQPAVDYDVLKVAHHGSKNSTGKEFLTVIKPELSLISCGKDNRYGHPHKELLERLSQIGCERFITYECGAITITTEGKNMIVDTYCVTEGRP